MRRGAGRVRWRSVVAVAAAATVVAGVSTACGDSDSAAKEVTLLTHDSFDLPQAVLDDFTKQTGLTLKIVKDSDAGKLASTVALTPGSPRGDVVYGIDNTFASRVIAADALDSYTSPLAARGSGAQAVPGSDKLTAIDIGDVCLNVDVGWYEARKQAPPQTGDDILKPEYRGQTVVLNPSTASPGSAFLLGTIAAKGEKWQDYWRALKANDPAISAGWTDAYTVQFTASGGTKPIVVSYASSPAAAKADKKTTKALLDTCFRQVEYAGVLRGAANSDGAKKVIDFLLSIPVQQALPTSMYVYPVQAGTPLPPEWTEAAPLPPKPLTLAPDVIEKNAETWRKEWSTLMGA